MHAQLREQQQQQQQQQQQRGSRHQHGFRTRFGGKCRLWGSTHSSDSKGSLWVSVSHLRPQCGTEEKVIKKKSFTSIILIHITASHLKTPLAVYNSIHTQDMKLYSHRKKITQSSFNFSYLCVLRHLSTIWKVIKPHPISHNS